AHCFVLKAIKNHVYMHREFQSIGRFKHLEFQLFGSFNYLVRASTVPPGACLSATSSRGLLAPQGVKLAGLMDQFFTAVTLPPVLQGPERHPAV
ncbi:unnamed protein product, partial [Ectocarpus sp. 8 AP-2014]